jgi:hypothetical protein
MFRLMTVVVIRLITKYKKEMIRAELLVRNLESAKGVVV